MSLVRQIFIREYVQTCSNFRFPLTQKGKLFFAKQSRKLYVYMLFCFRKMYERIWNSRLASIFLVNVLFNVVSLRENNWAIFKWHRKFAKGREDVKMLQDESSKNEHRQHTQKMHTVTIPSIFNLWREDLYLYLLDGQWYVWFIDCFRHYRRCFWSLCFHVKILCLRMTRNENTSQKEKNISKKTTKLIPNQVVESVDKCI